ncbi:hypothetical protein [Henriciella mobilis]|uniref:hypothetical protein n=1 Tax=Henriciella mobilis TaxID=2305467 RepID=UPI0011C42BC2|nr:hypothetical protein [Henriciella mobilis]
MALTEDLEIYRQRYEAFRHLDKLRWQMFQIAVAGGPAVLAFGLSEGGAPNSLVMTVSGVLVATFAVVMLRIGQGIFANGKALKSVGDRIGDRDIPSPSKWYSSVSSWIAITLFVVGVSLFFAGCVGGSI